MTKKRQRIEWQYTLDLFAWNETEWISSQKKEAKPEIKQTLSKSRQTNSVTEFLNKEGKLDTAWLIEEWRASSLANAFAEDVDRQKTRKSDYLYQRELEDFLERTWYNVIKPVFEESLEGLKKLFTFIHDNKPTTHVLDEKKTKTYLLNRLEHNTYLDILFKKLNIYPGNWKLYNRFYGSIIELLKNPKIIQKETHEIPKEKIAEKINNFFTKQDVKITQSEIKNLSQMIYDLDIFETGITTIDYNSLSMWLQAYIKEDKNKREELNTLHLTPARFSRYLASLFISYNRTQDEKDDETDRKKQALNRMFQIQFLRTYKDKNKKADSNVIYRKDIDAKTEILQTITDTEKNSFSKEQIATIKGDLNILTGGSIFYFMTKVHNFITAEKLIDIIYNNSGQSPEAIKQILKDNFAEGKKIREEDEDAVTIFIQAAIKYFKKHRKANTM